MLARATLSPVEDINLMSRFYEIPDLTPTMPSTCDHGYNSCNRLVVNSTVDGLSCTKTRSTTDAAR